MPGRLKGPHPKAVVFWETAYDALLKAGDRPRRNLGHQTYQERIVHLANGSLFEEERVTEI